MNYYRRHLGDYHKAAGHLSATGHGIYNLLLDWYYSKERPIPDAIAPSIARSSKVLVSAVLVEFFERDGDTWRHRRCDFEILSSKSRSAQASESIKARWAKRNGNVSGTNDERNTSHKPIANTKEKDKSKAGASAPLHAGKNGVVAFDKVPDGVTPASWSLYRQVRRKKRAPETELAYGRLIEKLVGMKARGLDPEQAVRKSADSAWVDLYDPSGSGNGQHPGMSSASGGKDYTTGVNQDGTF